MERNDKITVLAAFFISLISIWMIILFFVEEKPQIPYSQIFLQEGSYSNQIENGLAVFSFRIQNREETRMNYSTEYFFGAERITAEQLTVEKGEEILLEKSLFLPDREPVLPAKLTIVATAGTGKSYSIWFWITNNSK